MFRRLLIVSFVLLSAILHQVSAQDDPCHLSLNGVVLDSESREELPGATIYFRILKTGISTDPEGRFQMESLCPGSYEIEIRFIGYVTLFRTVEVNHSSRIELVLVQEVIRLENVIVEGHREEILNAQPVISLTEADLEKVSGKTLAEALGSISGVNMLQTGATIAKPVIHGMHSNRVLLMVYGIRHEGQQWGFEHAPEIDPFMASEITVIKGAAAVQYGSDAIGGVVLINPPELPKTPGIDGKLNMVGQSNGRSGALSGSLQGNPEKFPGFGWRVQGTLKKAGNLKAPDYYLSNTGVSEGNLSTAVGYQNNKWGTELFVSSFNTELGILSASHIGNLTDLEDALERGEPSDAETAKFSYNIGRPFQKVNHIMIGSKSFLKLNNANQFHLSYGYQENNREEYDRVRQSNTDGPQLDFKLRTHSLDLHLDHRLFDMLSGSFGFTGQKQSNVFEGRQLIPNFKSYNAGIYLIEHYIKNKYELEAGFRYDYKFVESFRNESGTIIRDEFEFNNFSSVLGAIYQANKELNLRLNLSTAWRPPNINEQFSDGVHQGVASYEVGDPNLDSEKSFNVSLSANLAKTWISAELTAYYQYIDGFIFLEPQFPETVLTIRGAFPLYNYKQVDARFTGFDFDARVSVNRNIDWNIKAAVVRARDVSNDDYLIWIPSDRMENEFVYTFNQFKGFRSPYLSMKIITVAEQDNYPENTDFAAPPDNYTLLNFGAGSDIILGENRLGFHLSLENALNTHYREYMNRFRYFADEPGINFIVRLNYNF